MRSNAARNREPGIYDLVGTMHGEPALIAYAPDGEFTIRLGESAYRELSMWLADRGIYVPPSRPALFLV